MSRNTLPFGPIPFLTHSSSAKMVSSSIGCSDGLEYGSVVEFDEEVWMKGE